MPSRVHLAAKDSGQVFLQGNVVDHRDPVLGAHGFHAAPDSKRAHAGDRFVASRSPRGNRLTATRLHPTPHRLHLLALGLGFERHFLRRFEEQHPYPVGVERAGNRPRGPGSGIRQRGHSRTEPGGEKHRQDPRRPAEQNGGWTRGRAMHPAATAPLWRPFDQNPSPPARVQLRRIRDCDG